MEVDDIRTKRPRQAKLSSNGGDGGGGDGNDDEADRSSKMLRPWYLPASRIYRVSRASGGKDRHSKVYTSKGLRDRRVRLSVSTAIQFYDLQDRLGYDQPSKAIEWLIKSADSAIAKLPSLDSSFGVDAGAVSKQEAPNAHSSASETSKESVLSLLRTESRVKARERARERAAKEKTDGAEAVVSAHNLNPNSQGSFTELLTGGGINAAAKSIVTSTADYFGTESGLFGYHHSQQQQQQQQQQQSASFASQFGNSSSPIRMLQFGNAAGCEHHHPAEMQQFAFLAQQQPDHFFPISAASTVASGGVDHYDLNFSISSPLAGVHRGTLQSNSPSHHRLHHHHHHHQSSQLDGSGVIPFLFGTTAANGSDYSSGFDGHLQLCDGYTNLELKEKGKG